MTMASLTHPPGRLRIRPATGPRGGRGADHGVRLRLLPTGDGWSLVAAAGQLVFQAGGTDGRRRCLEFARTEGVLAVLS